MLELLASAVTPPILKLLTLVLLGVLVVSLILARFAQSLLAGYFLCGVIIANSGLLQAMGGQEQIALLADIGVVLLMFTLGIEFSLEEIKHLRKYALIGGGLQMGLCSIAFAALGSLLGLPFNQALVLGIIVSLSSTAVALKSFQESGQSGTPAARLALGMVLFQDLLAILLVAVMPSILGNSDSPAALWLGIADALGRGILFMLIAALIGKYLVPLIMSAVARTRSRELFTLLVISLCGGIALLGSSLGLSLALGAFAAGLVVSGSFYSHRVLSEILPFKDLFLTLFFVSAGLLIDLGSVMDNWQTALIGLLLVLLIKIISVLIAARQLGFGSKMGSMCAFAVANVGEFSIVLMASMQALKPLPNQLNQLVLVIAAVSMGLTPALLGLAMRYNHLLAKLRWLNPKNANQQGAKNLLEQIKQLDQHAIIVGYGPVGQALNNQLRNHGVATIIIDLNAETVKSLLKNGQPVVFGDVRHAETLELAHIERARLIAFTFPDIEATLASLPEIYAKNPGINLQARAKFPAEVQKLFNSGVSKVVHDEQETGEAMVRLARECYALDELSA